MSKDLFGGHAAQYAASRPTYADELFAYLSSVTECHELAWDVGTGSGQAALPLARYFARVWATDLSSRQLAQAPAHPGITWHEAPAEHSGLADAAVDLVTVAQAYHWMPHAAFHAEVRRVLKPRGVIAVWSYNLVNCTPDIDAVVRTLYRDVLGPYWEPQRKHVENGYADIEWPFASLSAPPFSMRQSWSVEQLIAYLETWSALQTYRRTAGSDPLPDAAAALRKAWGSVPVREVSWPLTLRLGRV